MKTVIAIAVPLILFLGFGQEVKEAIPDLTSTSSSSKPGPMELGNGQSIPDALQGPAFRYS